MIDDDDLSKINFNTRTLNEVKQNKTQPKSSFHNNNKKFIKLFAKLLTTLDWRVNIKWRLLQPWCNSNVVLHERWYITAYKNISSYKTTRILNLWIIALVDNCKKRFFFHFINCNKWLQNQLKLILELIISTHALKKAFSDNFRIFLFIQPSRNDTHRQRRPISNISKSFCFQVTYSLPFISYFATTHILLILFFFILFCLCYICSAPRNDLRGCYKSTPHTVQSLHIIHEMGKKMWYVRYFITKSSDKQLTRIFA